MALMLYACQVCLQLLRREHLHHARYWRRRDAEHLADPNPFVLRKQRAAGDESDSGERRKGLGSILTVGRRVI